MSDDIRSERIARIAEAVRDLTSAFTDRQVITDGVTSVPRKLRHPSILDQLRAGITATQSDVTGSQRPVPESAVPPGLEATERLDIITGDVRLWLAVVHVAPRATLEDNLHALVGAAHDLADLDLMQLDRDVAWYLRSARVYAGWDAAPWRPHATCYLCGDRDTLRIRYDILEAVCISCGGMWDQANIGVLADEVVRQGNREEAASLVTGIPGQRDETEQRAESI